MQTRNIFAGPYLDRTAHRRGDEEWFVSALANGASRVIPLWNLRNLVTDGDDPRAVFLTVNDVPSDRCGPDHLVLLGQAGGVHYFAYVIEAPVVPRLQPGTRFEDLRVLAPLLPAAEAGLLGYARAMTDWRRRHRFCGSCGSQTLASRAGHVLVCVNPACRHEQFPRLDPAIIVLVNDGESALLGRQASWPRGRYSTIAGFVEPGESLEDAVGREVLEETGVKVDTIEYHSSQPWPFPASLMVGFTARALTRTVQLRDDELEDARWFTRSELAAGAALLPPELSISYRLIRHWLEGGDSRSVRP